LKVLANRTGAALKFCFKTCIAMKFMDDDDDDEVLESPCISIHRSLKVLEFTRSNYAISATSLNNTCIGLECIQGGSKKSKLLYCVNSLLFLSHPVCFSYLEICQVFCLTQDLLIIVMFCFVNENVVTETDIKYCCNTVHAVNFHCQLVLENATTVSLKVLEFYHQNIVGTLISAFIDKPMPVVVQVIFPQTAVTVASEVPAMW